MSLDPVPWEAGASAIASRRASKEQAKLARERYNAQQHALQNFDWNPEYVSQHAPQFQRTESPVARAYLESFLTGSNPMAIQGTRAGADVARQNAQNLFNQRYGGWDALRARQEAIDNDPDRFAVSPIEREITPPTSYEWGPITRREERKQRRKERRERRRRRRQRRRERRRG